MKKAAFKTGQTVRYLGVRCWLGKDDKPIMCEGMEFNIIETTQPERGLGRLFLWQYEDPIMDEDKDGYNVIEDRQGSRWCIHPADKSDWEVVG